MAVMSTYPPLESLSPAPRGPRLPPEFHLASVEVHVRDADNVVLSYHNVLFHHRAGRMTVNSMDRIDTVVRLLLLRQTGEVGAVTVVAETADVSDDAAREKQREVLKSLASHSRAHCVGVIEGGSSRASLQRAFARLSVFGLSRFHITADLQHATVLLARKLPDRTAEELLAVAQHARALALEARGRRTLRDSA